MIRRAFPMLLALTCAACRPDADGRARPAAESPAPSAATHPASAPTSGTPRAAPTDSAVADAPPPPRADPPGTAYLVWEADSAHAVTAWVRDDGTVAATRPQAVIAAGGGVWAWTRRTGSVSGTDCGCIAREKARDPAFDPYGGPPGICPTRARIPVVAAVNLLDGRELPLLRVPVFPPPPPDETAAAPPRQDMTPIGSVGPYLFTERWISSYFCGANHGNESTRSAVFDLAHGAREANLVRGDTLRVLAPQARQARELLSRPGRAFTPLRMFSLTAVEPRWRAAGGLEVGYRFAADACWACGDPHAAGYFASERVPGPVPALLAPWASAPLGVRRYWRTHPPPEHAGWSSIPPADTARALRRFRSR